MSLVPSVGFEIPGVAHVDVVPQITFVWLYEEDVLSGHLPSDTVRP